jgi:hypothetical protein
MAKLPMAKLITAPCYLAGPPFGKMVSGALLMSPWSQSSGSYKSCRLNG